MRLNSGEVYLSARKLRGGFNQMFESFFEITISRALDLMAFEAKYLVAHEPPDASILPNTEQLSKGLAPKRFRFGEGLMCTMSINEEQVSTMKKINHSGEENTPTMSTMITLVVKTPRSSRASLSRILNNGPSIKPSKPICSLALSIKTITTLCCLLILFKNSIASPMEFTRSLGWSHEIDELEPGVNGKPAITSKLGLEKYPKGQRAVNRLEDSTNEESLGTVSEVTPEGEVDTEVKEESDSLLAILPFKHMTKTMSTAMWDAIYDPPILKVSKYGRYSFEDKTLTLKSQTRPFTQTERERVFRDFICPELELKLKYINTRRFQKKIVALIKDTILLYRITGEETSYLGEFLNMIRSRAAPSSVALFKSIEHLFRSGGVSTDLRRRLWNFMQYHAFHSRVTEDYLISLYRTKAFRKILIDYMTDLWKLDGELNDLAWPMHEVVLKKGMEATGHVPVIYGSFFMYHDYLLTRELNVLALIYEPDGSNADDGLKNLLVNRNELMELLDRDCLIYQILRNALLPDLVTELLVLPKDWRYRDDKVVLDLVDKSASRVRNLLDVMLTRKEDELRAQKEKKLLDIKPTEQEDLSRVQTEKDSLDIMPTEKGDLSRVQTGKKKMDIMPTEREGLSRVQTGKKKMDIMPTEKEGSSRVQTGKKKTDIMPTEKQGLSRDQTEKELLDIMITEKKELSRVQTQKELQAALNILLHLRAYGGPEVKDRIREIKFKTEKEIKRENEIKGEKEFDRKQEFSAFEIEYPVDRENNDRWSVRGVSQYRDLLQGMWRWLQNIPLSRPERHGFTRILPHSSERHPMLDSLL
ncbi:hypothetical protein CROQUDRAFT_107625 [Cronartium quercuum f. sp. fusiforme G11]|uniref:Uncharacterized protein n=1 Tax=Cronartium quercuum f. sp. fusiforme G11 TaxID=708437 RepID=A0A9P6NHF9_9BASI|nr:hypothetical protein CROQUDRAFT_107625 [Cronartium quercuum f. sp. fusiforme G11]